MNVAGFSWTFVLEGFHSTHAPPHIAGLRFFALRREIFDYMKPGDELVLAPFARLIAEKRLLGYRCERFWCMDTFKEQQELTDLANSGRAPWELWKPPGNGGHG